MRQAKLPPRDRNRTSFRLEHAAGKRLASVPVMHSTINFGMTAVAWLDSPLGLDYVFVLLKALMDALARWTGEDPRWTRASRTSHRGSGPTANAERCLLVQPVSDLLFLRLRPLP